MPRYGLMMFINILVAADAPKSPSVIRYEADMGGGRINRYLDPLVSAGYLSVLSVNGKPPRFQRTQQGSRAIEAYEGLQEEHRLSGTELSVLREVGDSDYCARLNERTKLRIKNSLTNSGLIVDGRLTGTGTTLLKQASDLFGLVNLALSV